MNNPISCLTANFIGRHPGYPMGRAQWTQYQTENEAFFRPHETFQERFDALVGDIQEIGFDRIDLWYGTLNPAWARPEYMREVAAVLERREMKLASLAGNIGDTVAAVEASCAFADALGCRLLTGDCPALERDFDAVCGVLRARGTRLALLNRTDKTPDSLRARVHGGVPNLLGVCVDTGAFAVQGFAPESALSDLRDVLMYVHLKDVKNQGLLQQCCRFGQGLVNLPACVQALRAISYMGTISIVDESLSAGPEPDLRASLDMLRSWLQ